MANTKKKILIVEDEPFLRKVLIMKLKQLNVEVSFAVDGEEAVKKIKKELPNLVLLDLILPKKHGFEVLKEIKKDPRTKNISVLILTNLGQESDIKKGKELGAIDYIIKASLSIQEVVDKINKVLK